MQVKRRGPCRKPEPIGEAGRAGEEDLGTLRDFLSPDSDNL